MTTNDAVFKSQITLNDSGLLSTALFYKKRRLYDQALGSISNINPRSRHYASALYHRSRIYMTVGDHKNALNDIEKAQEIVKARRTLKVSVSHSKAFNISLLHRILLQKARILFNIGDFELALFNVFCSLNLRRKIDRCSVKQINDSNFKSLQTIERSQVRNFWNFVPQHGNQASRLIRMLHYAIKSSFNIKRLNYNQITADDNFEPHLPNASEIPQNVKYDLLGKAVFRIVKAFETLVDKTDEHGISVSMELKKELEKSHSYVMNTMPFWYHIKNNSIYQTDSNVVDSCPSLGTKKKSKNYPDKILKNLDIKCKQDPIKTLRYVHKFMTKHKIQADDSISFHFHMLMATCLCSTGHIDAALIEFERAHAVAVSNEHYNKDVITCIHRASGCMLKAQRYRDVINLNERLLLDKNMKKILTSSDLAIIS